MVLDTVLVIIGFFLFLVVVAFVVYFVSIFNGLVRLRNNITKSWANIDVILKQRHDELPKLLDTVKGYMRYERGLLTDLTKLRESWSKANTLGDKAKVSDQISKALVTLFARAENYPNLKANENFQQLQQRISGLESELADRREFYNDSVTQFNIRIQSFPDMFVARMMHLQPSTMFQVGAEEKTDVKIDLP